MSLAGAQHKLPVIYRDGCLYEPAGDTPSTHILKPNHGSADFRDSVINEYFCMKLAGACSVPVSARLRLYNWFVFNLLIGNNDAHLKNLSFMADAAGIALAPHYDMLSTVVYHTKALGKDIWPDSPLTWPFSGCERVADVTRASVIAAGRN